MLKQVKIPFLFLLVLLSAYSLKAQTANEDDWFSEDEVSNEKKGKISGGVVSVPFGYSLLEQGPMNTFLEANGYDKLEKPPLSVGVNANVFVRNVVLKIGSANFLKEKTVNTNYQATSQNKHFELGLGYNLYAKKGFILYPTAHWGWAKSDVSLITKVINSPVDPVFQGSFTSTQLERKSNYIGADIGFDYMFGFDESSGSGLSLGMRVGYNHQVSQKTWTSQDVELTGGPDIDHSGLYFRVNIGFAGWHRQ